MSGAQDNSTQTGQRLRKVGGPLIVIVALFGLSYCEEFPKYRFEKRAQEIAAGMPGTRLVGSRKSGDLASPVSWFWPATTSWTYAIPDPLMQDRFILFVQNYGNEPVALMIDTDCKEHAVDRWYALDEPDTALPAIGIFGQPVRTRDGRMYRIFHPDSTLPASDLQILCDTDWTKERKAVQAMK